MRRRLRALILLLGAVCLLAAAGPLLAVDTDTPKPDELQKMYNDALVQLRAAQDRKNELADENDKLAAKIADLQKQLKATQDQLDALDRASATWDDRWFEYRARDAAWRNFIAGDPNLQRRWNAYYDNIEQADPALAPGLMDPLLQQVQNPAPPIPSPPMPATSLPTTAPATQMTAPATQPRPPTTAPGAQQVKQH